MAPAPAITTLPRLCPVFGACTVLISSLILSEQQDLLCLDDHVGMEGEILKPSTDTQNSSAKAILANIFGLNVNISRFTLDATR